MAHDEIETTSGLDALLDELLSSDGEEEASPFLLLDDSADKPADASGDGGEEADRFDDILWFEPCLQESRRFYARVGETMRSTGMRFGCGYAEIIVSADDDAAHVSIDSGIRVPADRIDEINKLTMLCNRRLRLAGFAPVSKPQETVKFSFSLSREAIERAERTEREKKHAADLLARLMSGPGDEDALEEMRRAAHDSKLEHGIGMAASSVRSYTGEFSAVAQRGKTAIETYRN